MSKTSLASLLNDAEEAFIVHLELDIVLPDSDQPRKVFSEEGLQDLANSMKVEGVIKPIEVSSHEDGMRYVIRDGERRWRAAALAGLATIPAIIKEVEAERHLRRQLIANLHHENMSEMDEAIAIKALVHNMGSPQAVADVIGKSTAYISKRITILNSPAAQELAAAGVTSDIETLGSVAQVEKVDPVAAAALVEVAKERGLSRADARAHAAQVKQRPTAPPTREVKSADEDDKAKPEKPRGAGPIPLAKGEALAIEVSISPESPEAARFAASIEEHGAARLYPAGTAGTPTRCWVQFGDSDKKKKDDLNPRTAEFDCADLSLYWVTKYKAG